MKRKSDQQEQEEQQGAPKQARVPGSVSLSSAKIEGKVDVSFGSVKWCKFNPLHLGPVSMLLSDQKTSVTFKDLSTLWAACYPATVFVNTDGGTTTLTPDYDKYATNMAASKSKQPYSHGAWAKYIVVDGTVFPAAEANKRLYIDLYRKHVEVLSEFKELKKLILDGKDVALRALKSSKNAAASTKSLDEWAQDGDQVVPWEVVLLNMLRD
jgi:hypothetical protein